MTAVAVHTNTNLNQPTKLPNTAFSRSTPILNANSFLLSYSNATCFVPAGR